MKASTTSPGAAVEATRSMSLAVSAYRRRLPAISQRSTACTSSHASRTVSAARGSGARLSAAERAADVLRERPQGGDGDARPPLDGGLGAGQDRLLRL